jgi:predicted RNase H-like HicB family nuclease
VSFPDLPGCYGAGESYDEAIENAKISLREYALALADDGDEMPKPRTHSTLAGDAAEAIEMDKAAFVIEVPLLTVGTKRRVNVSLDDKVLAAIDRACELSGMKNRSAFLTQIALNWLQESMGAVVATPKKGQRRSRKLKLAVA